MRLEDLTDVHATRNTKRVEHNVDGGAIGEEGHVFGGENLGDNTLVAVTTSKLVALGDLALLRDVDTHQAVDAGRKLVAFIAVEDANANDLARLTMRNLQ